MLPEALFLVFSSSQHWQEPCVLIADGLCVHLDQSLHASSPRPASDIPLPHIYFHTTTWQEPARLAACRGASYWIMDRPGMEARPTQYEMGWAANREPPHWWSCPTVVTFYDPTVLWDCWPQK